MSLSEIFLSDDYNQSKSMVKGGRGGIGRGGRSHGKSHGFGRSHGHGHHHGSSFGRSRFGSSRFGRSRFGHFGRRHRYIGGRRYRSYGYGSSQDAVAYYEQQMDQVYNSSLAPVFFNGALTYYGRDSTITNHLNSFQPTVLVQYQQAPNLTQLMGQPIYQEMTMDQYFPNGVYSDQNQFQTKGDMTFDGMPQTHQLQPQIDPMFQGLTFSAQMNDDTIMQQIQQRMQQQMIQQQQMYQQQMMQQQQMGFGVNQLNIITVGSKQPGNRLCYIMTHVFMCLIFPIFFLCCNWWKKMVYPKYRVNPEFYRAVGQFVRNSMTCTTVKLTVCDNQFNSEKVHLLRDGLMGTQIQSLTVVNMAKAINYDGDEVDNFLINVQPLKELPFATAFIWDEQAA